MKLKDSNPILPSHSPLLQPVTRASQFHHSALPSAASHHVLSCSQHTLLSVPSYHPTISY